MYIQIKQCPICGNDFEVKNNRMQIYCSPKCKDKKHSMVKTERYRAKRQQEKAQEQLVKSQAEYRNHIVNYAEEQKAKTIAMIWGEK